MIDLKPIYVDTDAGCIGVTQPISFADTVAQLVGVSIVSSEMTITEGAEKVTITRQWSESIIDGEAGGSWSMRGLAVGFVSGEIKLRLSDGEHVIEPFEFQVLP